MPWFVLVCNSASCDYLNGENERIDMNINHFCIFYGPEPLRCHHRRPLLSHHQQASRPISWIKHYLIAFDTSGCVFLFITSSTIDLLFAWYKRFGANGCFAYATGETFFMPLSRLVFHFLCAYEKNTK